MRILVCGSRTFSDYPIVERSLLSLVGTRGPHTIIEGGAKGADALAARFVDRLHGLGLYHVDHEQYPADWDKYGKAAGPTRNLQMLDEGKPDLGTAFVDKPLRFSRGTANMVGLARQVGLPFYVIHAMAPGIPDLAKVTEF